MPDPAADPILFVLMITLFTFVIYNLIKNVLH